MKIGKRDIALVHALRNNARLSLTQMSKTTKIPISTLYDKLKARERDLILKHTTLIDFSKLGYDTKATFLIKAPPTIREKLKGHLIALQEVNAIYRLTNEFDFLVEGIFEKVRDAQTFKEELERCFSQIECNTHFVVEDIKREGFFVN